MEQTVSEVMTTVVVTLPDQTSLVEAARAMRLRQIGDVVVTRDGTVAGVATDRDIVIRGIAEGRDPATTRLAEIVSGPVVRVEEDSPISDAAALMREHSVRRLVVTDDDGSLAGIVLLGDLAVEQDPHSTLGMISDAPPNT
jgi:CBS domain-containing protein